MATSVFNGRAFSMPRPGNTTDVAQVFSVVRRKTSDRSLPTSIREGWNPAEVTSTRPSTAVLLGAAVDAIAAIPPGSGGRPDDVGALRLSHPPRIAAKHSRPEK
jgi:hypothetical protein